MMTDDATTPDAPKKANDDLYEIKVICCPSPSVAETILTQWASRGWEHYQTLSGMTIHQEVGGRMLAPDQATPLGMTLFLRRRISDYDKARQATDAHKALRNGSTKGKKKTRKKAPKKKVTDAQP